MSSEQGCSHGLWDTVHLCPVKFWTWTWPCFPRFFVPGIWRCLIAPATDCSIWPIGHRQHNIHGVGKVKLQYANSEMTKWPHFITQNFNILVIVKCVCICAWVHIGVYKDPPAAKKTTDIPIPPQGKLLTMATASRTGSTHQHSIFWSYTIWMCQFWTCQTSKYMLTNFK